MLLGREVQMASAGAGGGRVRGGRTPLPSRGIHPTGGGAGAATLAVAMSV